MLIAFAGFSQFTGGETAVTKKNKGKSGASNRNIHIYGGMSFFRYYEGLTGWASPHAGIDVKTKDWTWGTLTMGARVGQYNLEDNANLIIWIAGAFSCKLYLNYNGSFSPYVVTNIGIGYFDDWRGEYGWYQGPDFYGGGGVGIDMMFARGFGMNFEVGSFSDAIVRTGFVTKF